MASKQQTKSAANDMQSLFDPQGYQDLLKTWASMNERLTNVMVEGKRCLRPTFYSAPADARPAPVSE